MTIESGRPDGAEPAPRRAFGSRVRTLRQQARLTQEELADRAGLSPRSIRNIESGRVNRPRRESVRLIATVLDVRGTELAEFSWLSHGDFWSRDVPGVGADGAP